MPPLAVNGLCRPAPRALSLRLAAYCRPSNHEVERQSSRPDHACIHRHASTSSQALPQTHDQPALFAPLNTSSPASQRRKSYHDPSKGRIHGRTATDRHELSPVDSKGHNLAAWLPAIQSELPDNLRDTDISPQRLNSILRTLSHIRKFRNTNVMADLGFRKLLSWDAIEFLLKAAADKAKPKTPSSSLEDLVLSVPPSDSRGIDQMIDVKNKEWKTDELLTSFVPRRGDASVSLDQLTALYHNKRMADGFKAGSEVWYGLGGIIRRCISTPDNAKPMHVALEVLRYLDRRGEMPKESLLNLQKGPSTESETKLRSLLENQGATDTDGAQPAVHSSASCAALFEYVLWACLLSGRVTEARALLVPSGDTKGREGLLFTSGAQWDSIEDAGSSSASVKADKVTTSAERVHVSGEVITAIVDATLCDIAGSYIRPDQKPKEALEAARRLRTLRRMLEVSKQRLIGTTWDSVVASLLDGGMPSTLRGTRHMASVLRMANPYIAPDLLEKANERASDHISDGSAVIVGLYHQTMDEQIKSRDAQGAISSLEGLQDFLKFNKERSVRELSKGEEDGRQVTEGNGPQALPDNGSHGDDSQPQKLEGENHASNSLQIPPAILGGLLDLVTETDMEHVGNRMIYSDDIDGPLIGPQLYGHAKVAPALIRHATATNDMKLLGTVTKVQDSKVAGETLVALCYSYASRADWNSITRVIGICRKLSQHKWKTEDVALVAKALITRVHNATEQESAVKAALLLQRFLSGDLLGEVGPPLDELEDLTAVVASLDANMASLCWNLVPQNYRSRAKMSIESFNILLEGIARAYGTLKAQEMYSEWCTSDLGPSMRVTQQQQLSTSSGKSSAITELFGRADAMDQRQAGKQMQIRETNGTAEDPKFKPNLATIRIVIAQALKENHSSTDDYVATTVDQALPRVQGALAEAETMEWAHVILRRDFGMNYNDSNYELHGYLKARAAAQGNGDANSETAYYRNRTLIAWLVASEEDGPRTAAVEEEMRSFALVKTEQELEFDAIDAIQCRFLENLADDFGLTCESTSRASDRGVIVRKLAAISDYRAMVPTAKVAEKAIARFAM